MTAPHKHAAFIKAWADGARIEYFHESYGEWRPADKPTWKLTRQYRLAPAPVVSTPTVLTFPPRLRDLKAHERGALKTAAAHGAVIEYYSPSLQQWSECLGGGCGWYENDAYRVKPGTDPLTAMRAAQAAGAMVEARARGNAANPWFVVENAMFDSEGWEYRLRPTPKPAHAAVRAAWERGEPVEFRCGIDPHGAWMKLETKAELSQRGGTQVPGWFPEWEYRVKVKPAPVQSLRSEVNGMMTDCKPPRAIINRLVDAIEVLQAKTAFKAGPQ